MTLRYQVAKRCMSTPTTGKIAVRSIESAHDDVAKAVMRFVVSVFVHSDDLRSTGLDDAQPLYLNRQSADRGVLLPTA
jgi:hypothetical protein